jgi:hypothetical protein
MQLGPFRSAGDLRLWVALTVLWGLCAGIYFFYLHPPASVYIADLPFQTVVGCTSRADSKRDPQADAVQEMQRLNDDHGFQLCVENARLGAEERDFANQVQFRVFGLMLLPPFALMGCLWGVVAIVRWVRQGYD